MEGSSCFELITLGDELLLGLTPNGHLTFIGNELRRHGVTLGRNVVIPDDADTIGRQFRESWARADVILTTGGLGPTCDDRTRETIAEVLGLNLVHDPAAEQAMVDRFKRLGKPVTANNFKQAYKPEGALVLENPYGTAPGLWLEKEGKILVMLPGPPNELQPMFLSTVLPKLRESGRLGEEEAYLQLKTAGVGESALETLLQPVFDTHPGLEVAFCAHPGQVDCRLSASDQGGISKTQLQEITEECRDLLGANFICFGHDSVEKIVSMRLKEMGQTLAVAESCTGGLLASTFTSQTGASKFFSGAIICYSNDCKVQTLGIPECVLKQHGAVSPEVAVALAAGVAEHLGADYGLSITGFAGSCCSKGDKKGGKVYIGLYAPEGVWSKEIRLVGAMATVKERAITAALDWLRRMLFHPEEMSVSPVEWPQSEARKFLNVPLN